MQIATAYYTIYYGLSHYRYDSKPPLIGRHKVARELGIPIKNIDIGIYGNCEMWSISRKPNKLMLMIGQIILAYVLIRQK